MNIIKSPRITLWSFTALIEILIVVGIVSTCVNTAYAAEPSAFATWARTARIGGAAVWIGMEDAEMDTLLNQLAAQNVSVIEADSDLSNYLTEAEFNQELALMTAFTQKAHAHAAQFKVVWYYPSLEVLTANAASTTNTMAKNHPDWVQWGIDNTPNVFIGGSGQVFWVEPGMESAWMSPSSPYRDYFYARIARIASETGVDGLWADVPLYSDFGPVRWADANPFAAAEFLSKTSLSVPLQENWNDLAWRRWISWRHDELRRFLSDAVAAARANKPEFAFIVETLPTDYTMSTVYGLEGVDLRPIEGLTHVWEVDTLSNASAMNRANEDDWISYTSAQKYIKAASGTKPAWSFAYGLNQYDAELVMAVILASGNNPYELKIPEMTTTVGAAYRTKMFGWIKANESNLWREPAARVAVLYSTYSRDFVDKASGEGLFVSTTPRPSGDDLWWNDDPTHSAYQRQYVAEYRGVVKLLLHNHIPFDAVVKPESAGALAKYQTVILPDWEAVTDSEAQILRDYVNNGGHIIVTGPNPGGMDQYGTSRSEYALSDVFGLSKASTLPTSKVQAYGAGDVRFFSALLGKKYFTNASDAAAAATSLLDAINATSTSWLTTDANRKVHMELSQAENKLILQYVNFIGMNGPAFTEVVAANSATTASTTLKIPAGKGVAAVELTSPDNTTPALAPLAYTTTAADVTFSVPIKEYSMVVVSLTDTAPPPAPVLAIAAADAIKSEGNTGTGPFTFTVTRTGNLSQPSSAGYAVAGIGANPADAADFSGALTGTVSFAANEANQTINVNVVGDTAVEPDEGFTVTLSNPTNATLGTAAANGTILNDDQPPTLSIVATDATKAEGSSGTTAFTFAVARTGDLSQTSSASYNVAGSGGSPADTADFSGTLSGTVSFAANEPSQTITVNVVGDTAVEPNEGFTVTLRDPTNATLGTVAADGAIQNDDAALDTDADGVSDSLDNCRLVANTNQRNTDGDSYGNACDPDLNNDNVVNFLDLGLFKARFLTVDPDADFNGDGAVNFLDLGTLKNFFLSPPGPAGGS